MLVRRATAADVPTMVQYIHELAEYEREPEAVRVTPTQLHEALFSAEPHLFAHVVELNGRSVGMAIWFLNFSTWEGTHGIYVEDLYVTADTRGRGAGRALLSAVARVCIDNGYARLELAVLDWNLPAVSFYRSIGATGMDEWTVQRVTGEALNALVRA